MARGSLDFSSKEVFPSEELFNVLATDELTRFELERISVIRAVHFAREGCFLTLFPRSLSFPRNTKTKWVWLDSEHLSIVWESEEDTLVTIQLKDVKRIISGNCSSYFRRKFSDPERRKSAFELRIVSFTRNLRLHYRMMAHDHKECNMWLVALGTTILKAAKLSQHRSTHPRSIDAHPSRQGGKLSLFPKFGRPVSMSSQIGGWLDVYWETVVGNELASVNDIIRLLVDMDFHADRIYVEALFKREDTDGIGLITSTQFSNIFNDLVEFTFLRDLLNDNGASDPPPDTGPYIPVEKCINLIMDRQYSTRDEADNLVRKVIDQNKHHYSRGTMLTYLGLLKALKDNYALNTRLAYEGTEKGELSIQDYWWRATYNPFESTAIKEKSDLALCLQKCIDMGYRCFALYIENSESGNPVVKKHEGSPYEISVSTILRVIKDRAFVRTDLPIILILDIRASTKEDKSFLDSLSLSIQNDVGSLLCPDVRNGEITLKEVLGQIIIAVCADYTEDYVRKWNVLFLQFHSRLMTAQKRIVALDRCLVPPQPDGLSHYNHTASEQLDTRVAAIKFEKRRYPFRCFTPLDFVSYHQFIASETTPEDEANSSPSKSVLDRVSGLTCVSPCVRCASDQPYIGEEVFYFKGCNLICESIGQPSYATNAILPHNASVMNRNIPAGSCELTVEVLSGYMLPCSVFETDVSEPFSPYVEIRIYGSSGLVMVKRASSLHAENYTSRKFQMSTTVQLNEEASSIVAFEVRHHSETGSVLLGWESLRVSWLKTGIRWIRLKDGFGRHVPWSGLWINSQKVRRDIVPRAGKKSTRFSRVEQPEEERIVIKSRNKQIVS